MTISLIPVPRPLAYRLVTEDDGEVSDELSETDAIWPRKFWLWVALAPLGLLALALLYLDGVGLASLAFQTIRTLGVRAMFISYVLGAVVAPMFVWRRMRARGAASACLRATGLSVMVSILMLPVVLAYAFAFPM